MKGKIKKYLKIMLILLMAFVMLTFSNFVSKGEEYSEIIDYRKKETESQKGLILHKDAEVDYNWSITNYHNFDINNTDGDRSKGESIGYHFDGNPFEAVLEVTYNNIGKYIDESGRNHDGIKCKATYSHFKLYPNMTASNGVTINYGERGRNRVDIYKTFYDGFGYLGIESLDVKYEFFYQNSNNPIPLKNTFFTANSLTWNEGVCYKTRNNSPAYLNEDYYGTYNQVKSSKPNGESNTIYSEKIGNYRYFFGRAIARQNGDAPYKVDEFMPVPINDPNYVWFDDWIGKNEEGRYASDYEKGSVSFLLNDINDNNTKFEFTYFTKFKYHTHGTWAQPSTAPLGTSKIAPIKKVNKQEVNPGEEIEYTVTQKLHKTGVNIITNYLNLRLEDKLPQEVEYISSEISSPDINNLQGNMNFNYDRGTNTISYDAKNEFLENLDLNGQTITWKIKCKVKTNQNAGASTKFKNKSTTYMNYYKDKNGAEHNKFDSNEVYVQILPVLNASMQKTSNPTQIKDTEQRVNYTLNYSGSIKYYQGEASITIVDTLPYKIDTSKSYDLNGGTYNANSKTITWKETTGYINTIKEQKNITLQKKISVVFLGIDKKASGMTNSARATLKTLTPERSKIADASAVTSFNFRINITAKKNWDDQGRDRSRRSEPLIFVLYQNGKPTDKTYTLNPKTKDSEEYTFKDLRKYDDNGNRINYEVKEISKQSGNNYYRLQDMKTEVVEERKDLRYYVDSTTSEQDTYESGGQSKVFKTTNTYKSINIKGNVWLDSGIDGRKTNGENGFKGVSVQLLFKHGGKSNEYEYYGYTVRTDQNGNYSFNDIPWNGTYKIRFNYNGQIYESTYYKNDLSGGYSNAKEYNNDRDRLNRVFENINAYPSNYGNGKRAFGLYEKLKSVATNNFIYNSNGNPYTFINDVLPEFNNIGTNYNDYNASFYNALKGRLINKGIDATTANSLTDYIKDCIIFADTQKDYYITDPNALKPGSNNNISSVDFGIAERVKSNLSIKNDIYKVIYTINGKQFDEYDLFNKKPGNIYNVAERAKNGYYNGNTPYNKPIYKSDYLYNGKDVVAGGENRNLQMYVTYKIVITNSGQVSASVRSLDTYYDSKNYDNFSETKNLKACKDNINLGSFTDEDTNEKLRDYKKLKLKTSNPVLIHPGQSTEVLLTFKIKTEKSRVKISETKRNIVEINSYSTYYTPEDNVAIPDTLQGNNKVNKRITGTKAAGLVDVDSDPGSLRETDLTVDGNLIYNEQRGNSVYQRIENDTDKAPDLNITLSGESRSISGFVFEDNRNVRNDQLKTSLGNGKYDNGETKVNGVTVQLVELVREIDPVTKLQTDNYAGEYVWSECKYKNLEEMPSIVQDEKNYYTGKGVASIIISGEGAYNVAEIPLGGDSAGKYQFNSFIPGDYFVRFTYGDTNRTVLTDDATANTRAQAIGQLDSKNNPLSVNKVVNDKGLNAKSYNGQDFKSTIYQSSVNQAEIASYNGINGYTNFDNQNFINSIQDYYDYKGKDEERETKKETINKYSKSKDKMYLYSNSIGTSNAKDLYGDRQRIQDRYGEKKVTSLYEDKQTGVTNRSGEILQSYEKLASDNKGNQVETQKAMIEDLKNNTQVRAQSGIMDIEIVHNNNTTNQATLGLVERAKSQVTLTKEVTSVNVVLQNGKSLFNSNKSVNNLYFGKHSGHSLKYDGYRIKADSIQVNKNGGYSQPELIQAYIDSELMGGATLSAKFRITARNVGEVDFNDTEFYYSGKERNPNNNITKTIVNRVVDYISNSVTFDVGRQEESSSWKLVKTDDLVNNGLVTGKYRSIMNTYNSILVTEGLNKELIPEQYKKEDSFSSVELVLDSTLSNVLSKDSMVYNNLLEAIQVTNKQGRGSNYSIPGNEEMSDQTLVSNAKPGESVLDRRVPEEIDADSAQKIVFMPPTGEENYVWIILVSVISAGIIAGGILVIKKLVFNH